MEKCLLKRWDGAEPLFVFDLDSTVTKCELLPRIAALIGMEDEMARRTEEAMESNVPFIQNFKARAALLKDIPLSRVRACVAQAPLNHGIARFLHAHSGRCRVLTGNLDVWVEDLMRALGMDGRYSASHGCAVGDRLVEIADVLDKEAACRVLPHPFIAIGDGSNDLGMLKQADFAIAFGGVRPPSDALMRAADVTVWNENDLLSLLEGFIQEEEHGICIDTPR